MITFDQIFGDGGRSQELDKLLIEIQDRHSNLLIDILGHHENGDPKTLVDLRTIYYMRNGLVDVRITTELPDNIKNECIEAIKKVYGENSID